ncbi:hypothetical protein [Furfurilactobacillus milii]|uniref:hypothetical protein n=1 Tax=Furfurilactobacillus milii TaxID=2888272 RepID=UPI001F1CF60D|nr:hypothetical protein [Furfurilactobacillus milii]MCF6419825.1 hypothetical protein [Furfurilactobacillus milii]
MTDINVFYDMTVHEYNTMLKGALLARIDDLYAQKQAASFTRPVLLADGEKNQDYEQQITENLKRQETKIKQQFDPYFIKQQQARNDQNMMLYQLMHGGDSK